MTTQKSSLIALIVVAGIGLSVWLGPEAVRNLRTSQVAANPEISAIQPEAVATPVAARARSTSSEATGVRVTSVELTPQLQDRVHPLLSSGTDPKLAVEGFTSRQQFVATAHAARNTGVPFVLLKDRQLRQHRTLKQAIHELKPDINASVEANRARLEAAADLAGLGPE